MNPPILFSRVQLKYLFWIICIPIFLGSCTQKKTPQSARFIYAQVKNGAFYLENKPLFIKGCNYWYGGYIAQAGDTMGYNRLKRELDFLHKQGINNIRVMVSSEGDYTYPYRISPSLRPHKDSMDTALFYGFDALLYELNLRNMTATMVLGNNWEWSGGFGQYLDWHKEKHGENILPKTENWDWDRFSQYLPQFYTCDLCKSRFQNTISHILNRKNQIDGILYQQHPAIFAWELANEPRPMLLSAWNSYKNWISETASLIHQTDSNHLIAIGQEGCISLFNDLSKFQEIHELPNIDYATIHIWPKTWNWYDGSSAASVADTTLDKTVQYIEGHANICKKIKKPLVIEEFGLHRDGNQFNPESSVQNRYLYYGLVLNEIKNFNVSGFNFWGAIALPQNVNENGFMLPGSAYSADPPQEEQGLYGVYTSDSSIWQLIRSFHPK